MEDQRKITEDNMKMFGDLVWRHTIVLFTCGDQLGDMSIEEHIESEGEPLQWLIEKCGNRYHVMSWNDKLDDVMELLMKVEHMVIHNSLFWPEPKAQNPVDKDTTQNQMDVPSEIIDFLDQKWKRMDKELEMKLVEIEWKGSMDVPIAQFSDSHQSPEEELSSKKGTSRLIPPEAASSKESGSNAATGHEDQQRLAGEIESIREMLEKEWGRRELGVTQRIKCLFTAESPSGSEDDVHDLNRSCRKVIRWMENQTSGIVSDSPPDTDEVDEGLFQ